MGSTVFRLAMDSCHGTFDRRSNSNGEKERSMWRPLRIEANYSQRRTPIIPCH